jgi:hypothetical protein
MQTAANVSSGAVRVSTPQIHWHGKSPIFAIDFHPRNREWLCLRLLWMHAWDPWYIVNAE